jgi:uncharacterized damage-inducible protein DinB
MQRSDLLTLYEYNYWANAQILAASATLSPEQWVAPTSHSFGSLRGTMVHTLDAEYGWRMLLQHQTATPLLEEETFPTVAALVEHWQTEEQAMHDYLHSLSDAALNEVISYEGDGGDERQRQLWHCLWHVVNHGTQHRSEAAAILTDYGASPGELDFTMFLNTNAPK